MEFHSGMMSPSLLWISTTIRLNQRAPPAEPFMAAEIHPVQSAPGKGRAIFQRVKDAT
jgi:hypothetical protein